MRCASIRFRLNIAKAETLKTDFAKTEDSAFLFDWERQNYVYRDFVARITIWEIDGG